MTKPVKLVVRVTCSSTDLIDPKKLTPFQGELKWLEDKQYEKLKTSLLNHGFVFPVFGWKHKRKNYTIDAHQRLLALEKMKSEGITLVGDKVPIVWVEADNEVDAKKLIMLAVSQYGRYDYDSMYKFMKEAGIDFDDVKREMDFPAFNMGTFGAGWFNDGEIVKNPNGEWRDMPEYKSSDQTAYQRIVIHFANDADVKAFAKLTKQKVTKETQYLWFPKIKKQVAKDKEYQ